MTTANRVHKQLKSDIVTCKLAPGRGLSEMELAKRYEASRTPVREACRRLEHDRLIDIITFRGYFIVPQTVADLHNLHELQLIVNPAAPARTAQRSNPSETEA